MWLSLKYGLSALFVRSCGVTVSGFLFDLIFSNVYQVCHNSTFWIIVIYVDVHNNVLSFRKSVILFVYLIAY